MKRKVGGKLNLVSVTKNIMIFLRHQLIYSTIIYHVILSPKKFSTVFKFYNMVVCSFKNAFGQATTLTDVPSSDP